MAFENGRYYCDRCGKKIIQGQDLCKQCNEWLEEYIKAKQKDKGANGCMRADIQRFDRVKR